MELNGSFQKGEFKDELGKIQYKKYNNNKLKETQCKTNWSSKYAKGR